MLGYLPILIILIVFGLVAGLGFADRRKKRLLTDLPPMSFMVPCFNDADSVGHTLYSIYEVCGSDANVIVIDDCSTDGSREKLATLRTQLGFTLISTIKRMYFCFMIVPFSIFYIPAFSVVSIVGAINFLRKRRSLLEATRAW